MANKKAVGTEANAGNTAPLHLRKLPMEQAVVARDQYNAESTYNPWANKKALGHLGELKGHLDQLAEVAPSRTTATLQYLAAKSHELSTPTFSSHPDILGSAGSAGGTTFSVHPETGQVVSRDSGTTGATPGHINDIHAGLSNLASDPNTSDAARHHINNALNSVADYKNTFSPAKLTTYPQGSKTPGTSVEINPEFRENIEATSGKVIPFNKEAYEAMNETDKAAERAKLAKSGTVDGNYKKMRYYEENKKAAKTKREAETGNN